MRSTTQRVNACARCRCDYHDDFREDASDRGRRSKSLASSRKYRRRKSMTRIALCVFAILFVMNVQADEEVKTMAPDSADAMKSLQTSTRHGEWIDVPVEGSDTKLHCWLVHPERSDKAPVVIVIHEIFGMTDWVRAVTDQLAAEGFVAIAPDLLSAKGPNGGG